MSSFFVCYCNSIISSSSQLSGQNRSCDGVTLLGEECPAFFLQLPLSLFWRHQALVQGRTVLPWECAKRPLWLLSSSVGADTVLSPCVLVCFFLLFEYVFIFNSALYSIIFHALILLNILNIYTAPHQKNHLIVS